MKTDIKTVTYYDGVFYNKGVDPRYYFLERIGVEYKGNKGEGSDKEVNTNENNLNSTRVLKTDVEGNNEKGEHVFVLKENKERSKVADDVIIHKGVLSRKESETGKKVINSEYKGVTYHDYSMLPRKMILEHDKRGFSKYFIDELIYNNSVVKLIWKDTLIEKRIISYIKLITRINFTCALNAFTMTDDIIEERASNPARVIICKLFKNFFTYPLSYEFGRLTLVVILASSFCHIISLIVYTPKANKDIINEALRTQQEDVIKAAK
jgi:hypothetical protein